MKLILVLTASLLVLVAVSADSEETTHPHKLEDLHPGLILINQNIPIAKVEPHPHLHFPNNNTHSSRTRRDAEMRGKLEQLIKEGNVTGVFEMVKKVVKEGFGPSG